MFTLDTILLLGIIGLMLISEMAIRSVYNKYSNIEASLPKTGKEIVEEMLYSNGVSDVALGSTKGVLDDHYNSNTKRINLSKNSYTTNSIAAIAVAAHETGHALQDNTGYSMLKLRKFLAPICSFCSRFVWIAIFIGIIFQFFGLVVFGLILMGVTILFQVVTLPVEFDASRRAIKYLDTLGYNEETMQGIKSMLKAAAFTYLSSTIAALLQMIRLIIGLDRKD